MKPLYCVESPHHYLQLKPLIETLHIPWVMCVTARNPEVYGMWENNINLDNWKERSHKEKRNISNNFLMLPSNKIIKAEDYPEEFDYIISSTSYKKVFDVLLPKSRMGFVVKTPHSTIGDYYDMKTILAKRKNTMGIIPTVWGDREGFADISNSLRILETPTLPIVPSLYSDLKADIEDKIGVVINFSSDRLSVLETLRPIAKNRKFHLRLHPHPLMNNERKKNIIESKYEFIETSYANIDGYDLDKFIDSCDHLIGATTSAFSDAIIRARHHNQEKGFWRLPSGVKLNVPNITEFDINKKVTPKIFDKMVLPEDEIYDYFENLYFYDIKILYNQISRKKSRKTDFSKMPLFEQVNGKFTNANYAWEDEYKSMK